MSGQLRLPADITTFFFAQRPELLATFLLRPWRLGTVVGGRNAVVPLPLLARSSWRCRPPSHALKYSTKGQSDYYNVSSGPGPAAMDPHTCSHVLHVLTPASQFNSGASSARPLSRSGDGKPGTVPASISVSLDQVGESLHRNYLWRRTFPQSDSSSSGHRQHEWWWNLRQKQRRQRGAP